MFVAHGVLSNDERFAHVKANIGVSWKRVRPRPAHNRTAILICYGPSLLDTWRCAPVERQHLGNADIVSVSGAHDFLIERGIIPRFHVECDPRKHKSDMLTKPHRRVEYLIASCCHPDLLKKLKLTLSAKRIRLWHLNNCELSDPVRIGQIDPGAVLVGGGGSVGLRAFSVLHALGYRRFVVHGMDCSYRDELGAGLATHAGAHAGKAPKRIEVQCGGRTFVTGPALITYIRDFDVVRRLVGDPNADPDKIEIILRGDGLLQHALTTGRAVEIITEDAWPI